MTTPTAMTGFAPQVPSATLAPGTMAGEFRIEGPLGEGGMGQVYAAIHPVIGKQAAVKVLHPKLSTSPDAVQRFVVEARAVNQIGHPNIVDIFAFGSLPDGRQYFVMEKLRGESLRQRADRQPLSLIDTLSFIDTITLPLEAAHEAGIAHRDLKPDNVYLVEVKGERPIVKLLDFGIAKLLSNEGVQRTQTGVMIGTPAYISPEQARGENVDHRTDIYALGAMLFELLTGRSVFSATSAAEMIAKHLYEEPTPPSAFAQGIPPQLDALVLAMLAKDANYRPSLSQIRIEVRAIRTQLGLHTPVYGMPAINQAHNVTPMPMRPSAPNVHAPVAAPMPTIGTPARRSRAAWIIAGLLVAGGASAGIFFATQRTETPSAAKAPAPAETPPPATPPTLPEGRPKTTPVEQTVTPPAAETKPVETKPAETKPVEAKPDETKPDEAKPVETKPAETKRTETKPADKKRRVIRRTTGGTAPTDPDAPM